MPDWRTWEASLQWVSVVVEAALIVRLVHERLYVVYRWFFALVLFDAIRSIAGLAISRDTNAYAVLFVYSTPLMWLLYFLVVSELYELVLKDRPGIATAGRWVLWGGLIAAAVVTAWTLPGDFANEKEKYVNLRAYFAFHRAILSTLTGLVLVLTAFLFWFPVMLRRNINYYFLGFLIWFGGATAMLLLRNRMGQQATWIAGAGYLGASILCFLIWIAKLTQEGEQAETTIGHLWNPAATSRLLDQLDQVNARLLRWLRR